MLYNDIEPNVGLNLAEDMSVRARRNALDRSLNFREWLEKVDNTFADTNLLSLLVDIHVTRVEKVDLAVRKFLFGRLIWTRWRQRRVHDKD